MNKPDNKPARDYSETLFLPQTDFPDARRPAGARAGAPGALGEAGPLRAAARGGQGPRKFILHDGPPYANGNIHIGHALNKILKDVVTRSQQMLGFDSNYVPGWDCHGLPIEWKIEEENYRAKGKNKPTAGPPHRRVPQRMPRLRRALDRGAARGIQAPRRRRATGRIPTRRWRIAAEAQIAREIMKFAANGTLYRGSKPVMWSVVEKTALAEAEVEYEDYTSDHGVGEVSGSFRRAAMAARCDRSFTRASIVIWTTTPWTLPGNRAISLFAEDRLWPLRGHRCARTTIGRSPAICCILADKLAGEVMQAGAGYGISTALATCQPTTLPGSDARIRCRTSARLRLRRAAARRRPRHRRCRHRLRAHRARSWPRGFRHLDRECARAAKRAASTPTIPYTVDENGAFTDQAPGFAGKRVITDKGEKGDANEAVIKALVEAGMLIARGRLKHQYPHSWRSKKPVIFRNTPQWFIAMDKPIADANGGAKRGDTLRHRALDAIKETRWVPAAGENRITGMIESRPDWVISRQRAWGVPIAVFVKEKGDGSVEILEDEAVNKRIADAFEQEGADAWYEKGAARALPRRARHGRLDKDRRHSRRLVRFRLDPRLRAGRRGALPGARRHQAQEDGGGDTVMYLEGSDQHRGWFHSSLLESCGTRGVAPYDVVLTHGFVLDEHGRKMSKSLGNVVAPQDVMKQSGADILRMWVCASDYADDLRIGPEILKTTVETYRKLRNTIRWMLGNLAHFREEDRVALRDDAGARALMLHRLAETRRHRAAGLCGFRLQAHLRRAHAFMTVDLSAFYFDIRKDTLYCDPISSDEAQGLPHRARSSFPRDGDLACADALLHRRGGVAVALWRRGAVRASRIVSRHSGRLAR